MNKKGGFTMSIVLAVIILFVGIYLGFKFDDNENSVSMLEEENSQLRAEIVELQNQMNDEDEDETEQDEQDDDVDLLDVCPDGGFLEDVDCECEQGYTRTRSPGNAPIESGVYYYCKTDILWEEFDPCDSEDDCSEGYRCYSADIDNLDYRCAPDVGYATDCYCSLDGSCVCA